MKCSKLLACAFVVLTGTAFADTMLAGYGTYWDGDDSGTGFGLRAKKTVLAFVAVEGRFGYVNFNDSNTEVYPLDVSINARLPFMISPYAGIGTGYYFVDSDIRGLDNFVGSFVQVGVEATLLWCGAMAEVRYYDMEEDYLDGPSFNVGLLFKW